MILIKGYIIHFKTMSSRSLSKANFLLYNLKTKSRSHYGFINKNFKKAFCSDYQDKLFYENYHSRKADKMIYLDYQSTTPIDPQVLDSMLPYMTDKFGNPHSKSHVYGWETEKIVEEARANVAKIIGAEAKEIVFTSGATESNNLAIKGVAEFNKDKKKHIITTQIEHKCVLDTCRHLQAKGWEVTYLPVQSNGILDLDVLKKAIRPDTLLVSVINVHNEIGVIQPIKEIGKICRENKILFHTDCAQAVGKFNIDVNEMNIDLLSISGHKIYGPKGVGALYVRKKPRVRLLPQINGGGQEKGMRSGTLSPFVSLNINYSYVLD